ncbi:MAG: hypothetical protein DLM52_11940 [Chthoniobacterales bacterium]|nr:MAG: hypothetical protein DLM52_11940 [Chthoniobacterales bacterium]
MVRNSGATRCLRKGNDALGIGIRERTQQHAIDHAEDHSRAGDAEHERDGCYDGETGSLAQHSQAITNVVQKRVHDFILRAMQ